MHNWQQIARNLLKRMAHDRCSRANVSEDTGRLMLAFHERRTEGFNAGLEAAYIKALEVQMPRKSRRRLRQILIDRKIR